MWTEAFFAGVLVFDFERMPVGALDLNSHARVSLPQPLAADEGPRLWLERGYSESGGRNRPKLGVLANVTPPLLPQALLPQALFPQRERIVRIKNELKRRTKRVTNCERSGEVGCR
jgi:hypothetical protein